MGETPLQSSAPAEFPRQDHPAGPPPVSGSIPAGHSAADYPHAFPPAHPRPQHDQPTGEQHAFMSQLDMADQQRTGPFDMNALASALPQQPYRAHVYGQSPQRYNMVTMPSPGPATQIPVTQFRTPSTTGHIQGQPYYVPQHPHMPSFYPTPLSPQPPAAMPSRPDLGYYPNSVFVNQTPQPGAHFYYTSPAPFPGHIPHVHGQIAPGHYGPQSLPQPFGPGPQQSQTSGQDAGLVASPGQQGNSQHFNPMASTGRGTNFSTVSPESRQNIVRGPPRKPRQSGEFLVHTSRAYYYYQSQADSCA